MRVRIVKALEGVIEGHSLSHLIPGYVYEVDDFMGEQLITLNAAIEVRSTDPAIAGQDDLDRVTRGIVVVPPDTAEDRPERRRRKRR